MELCLHLTDQGRCATLKVDLDASDPVQDAGILGKAIGQVPGLFRILRSFDQLGAAGFDDNYHGVRRMGGEGISLPWLH